MRGEIRGVLRGALALSWLSWSGCDPAPEAEHDAIDAASVARGSLEDASSLIAADPDAGAVSTDGGDAARAAMDAGRETASDARTNDARSSDAQPPAEAGSVGASLPASLRAAGVQALFPPADGMDACVDPALRITFGAPPTLGARGKLQLFDSARPDTAFATLDLAQPMAMQQVADASLNVPRAAYVEGNSVVLYLPKGLAYGHAYFVRLEAGAVMGPGTVPIAIDDATTWSFRTRALAAQDRALIHVALDGSGEFCSLQGAFDALEGFQASAQISIAPGTYRGIAHARGKSGLTIRGADRKATILSGINNEQLNGGTAKRALISIENSRDVIMEKLTIQNLTPQGGSQAEALRLEGCERCQVRDAEILSLQDTILWSGRIYARDLLIAGNVDFVWGTGAVYFERCELKTLGRKGYTVQARNGSGAYGYVFVDSKLTSDPGINGHFLARVDAAAYPSSHVAFIDCELGEHVDAAGFLVSGGATSAHASGSTRARARTGRRRTSAGARRS